MSTVQSEAEAQERVAEVARDLTERPHWTALAACRGMGTAIFFTEPSADITLALSICRTCSVRVECLDFALAHRDTDGIWGGTSKRRRLKIRRRLGVRPPAHYSTT